jgi:acyl dehydratase
VTPVVGDAATPLQRRIELPDMIAYAGATWDWHRLHYDPEYLASKRVPAPVVDGQVFGALLAEQIQDWLGPSARLRELHFRFKNLVFAGEVVACDSTVTAVEATPDGALITFESTVRVLGDNERVAVAPAGGSVLLPS